MQEYIWPGSGSHAPARSPLYWSWEPPPISMTTSDAKTHSLGNRHLVHPDSGQPGRTWRAGTARPFPQQTFRASVDVVTIQASVRDARGRPVRGLTANDFEVRDNGQLRPMLSLRADLRAPVSLAILVDMSGSMRLGPKMAMVGQALDSVLSQLRTGDDEVGLFTFDSALHEREVFTRDLIVDGRRTDRVRAVRHDVALRCDGARPPATWRPDPPAARPSSCSPTASTRAAP